MIVFIPKGSTGDQTIVSHISQHGKNWPYWFRKMGKFNSSTDLHLNIGDGKLFYNCSEKWVNSTLKYATFGQYRWQGKIIQKLSHL